MIVKFNYKQLEETKVAIHFFTLKQKRASINCIFMQLINFYANGVLLKYAKL